MASYFDLTFDTAAPAGAAVLINGGAANCASTSVSLAITTSDPETAGYQMKLWGTAAAPAESDALWESFASAKTVALSGGDGLKTVSVRLRDALGNESAAVFDSITLNTAVPAVTVTGPDVSALSLVSGHDTALFSFRADTAFTAYKIKAVPSLAALHTAGAAIGTANGSVNMSGTGSFAANTALSCTLKAADLAAASAGDGVKLVKVFVCDAGGSWSVA